MTEIPVCPRERFSSYKTLFRLVPCYKRDWATCCTVATTCYLLLFACYVHLTKPSLVTATFSACSYYLAEIRLSEPSAPRWVLHSYLSKGLRLIPYTCGSSHMHQPTLMSHRNSNVTTSIHELIIWYASNNFRYIILNPTQRTSKSAPRFLLGNIVFRRAMNPYV